MRKEFKIFRFKAPLDSIERKYLRRDLYTVATLCSLYILSTISHSSLGSEFLLTFLYQNAVLILLMVKKLRGRLLLLVATFTIGIYCNKLNINSYGYDELATITGSQISFLWMFFIALPAFISRGFNLLLGLTKYEIEQKSKGNN